MLYIWALSCLKDTKSILAPGATVSQGPGLSQEVQGLMKWCVHICWMSWLRAFSRSSCCQVAHATTVYHCRFPPALLSVQASTANTHSGHGLSSMHRLPECPHGPLIGRSMRTHQKQHLRSSCNHTASWIFISIAWKVPLPLTSTYGGSYSSLLFILQPSVLSQHSCLFPLLCKPAWPVLSAMQRWKVAAGSAGAWPELSVSAAAAPELQPHSNLAMLSPGHHEPPQPGQQLQRSQERRTASESPQAALTCTQGWWVCVCSS